VIRSDARIRAEVRRLPPVLRWPAVLLMRLYLLRHFLRRVTPETSDRAQ